MDFHQATTKLEQIFSLYMSWRNKNNFPAAYGVTSVSNIFNNSHTTHVLEQFDITN